MTFKELLTQMKSTFELDGNNFWLVDKHSGYFLNYYRDKPLKLQFSNIIIILLVNEFNHLITDLDRENVVSYILLYILIW